jgi:superfamily I DNA/RNA helicase/RecB family exonuclease
LVRRPDVPAPRLADDPVQRGVVAHTGGPLLVLGGPGTGKTTTLVEAVAARVAEGVDPERILVLAFGRRPAAALRSRMEARIAGGGAVHEPLVRTFHAYSFGLLRRAAAQRGDPPPRLLTGPEQDLVIRELLEVPDDEDRAGWPAGLRPALRTRAFAGQLRDLLLRAAERGVGAGELAELGRRLGRVDWPAAARFMTEYASVLALREATTHDSVGYDPAELVRAAVALLRDDEEVLAAERHRLACVYVDELADTDPAQLDLLELVAGGGTPLVAFADPDSSTFAFRGADPGGVTSFPQRFRTAAGGQAPTMTLTRSHRAGEVLVGAAARVAGRLRGPTRHRTIWPLPETPGDVEVCTFRSSTSEAAFVAHRLREAHLRDEVPWSRMAVLMRSAHNQLPLLQRALTQAGIPTVIHAEDLPLHAQPAVAPLLLLLRCALQPDRLDEEAAVALLHSPLGGADPLSERRLRQGLRALALAGGDRRPSGVLLVEALRDPTELVAVERRWAAPARAVAGLLATARAAAARPGATAEEVLWAVWRASGLAERWAAAVSGSSGAGVPRWPVAAATPGSPVAVVAAAAAPGSRVAVAAAAPGDTATVRDRRAAAADRDLDAIVALFDAAARFTDRLPGARTEVFLDHVAGQEVPGDTLAPTADRSDAVRLLTAHAAKGLEWDVVAVPGVQEGVWPDLRLRGSLLGSEQLVDVVAGRAGTPGTVGLGSAGEMAGQVSALLDEERRLLYVAVTRARRRVLVTAVASAAVGGADGEEQPSRFLSELSPDQADAQELPVLRPPRALTLPALVAELRTAAADPASPPPRRRAAAAELARLAAAGVAGAHPDEWWGLRPLSDDRPLADEGETVRVTPSTMESALRCSLRWLLERHGGSAPATPAQGVGNLVHAAAMLAEGATADRAKLVEYIAARFDAIELAARWTAGSERARAESMVDKLLRWLVNNPRRLIAIESEFAVRVADDPARPIELAGRVDRLERDEEGRLVVIDLKTGKSTSVTQAEVAEHPQLGAYQAALEAGAFAEHGTESGGAALVQLGIGAEAREQAQPPVREAEDPGWARAMVRRAADTLAASTFNAVVNSKCRVCPVRTSCPVSGKGRQVVEP